jgi:rod shape determining protein RodA
LSRFDYVLFTVALLLVASGLAGVYSATLHGAGAGEFHRQLLWTGVGLLVCFSVLSVDYHMLADHAYLLYFGSLVMLGLVLLFGEEIHGSKSWVGIWGIGGQPSELVKVVVILTLTRYLASLNENYLRRGHFFTLAALTLAPVILVILQGDLGTALMFFPILIGMMLVAGLKLRFIIGALVVALCMAPVGWMCLKDYQKQRILATLDPGLDPQGVGYQVQQSQIAIGSGGMFGRGLGEGMQSQLGFVPEVQTDFIFSLLAEETGFVGACVLLLLFLVLVTRLFRIAGQARDRTGILIVTGIASLVLFHVVVNVGMTLGMVPPIGIPLPLVSYGGSSALSTFAALGLALNVHARRFVY